MPESDIESDIITIQDSNSSPSDIKTSLTYWLTTEGCCVSHTKLFYGFWRLLICCTDLHVLLMIKDYDTFMVLEQSIEMNEKAFFRIEKESHTSLTQHEDEKVFFIFNRSFECVIAAGKLDFRGLSDLSCLIYCIRFNVIDWFICVGRQSLQRRRSIPALTLILVQLRATWITWC